MLRKSLTFWITVSGAAAFLILLSLASWVFRDRVFQTFQDPGVPFQTYTPPDGADYSNASGWYAYGPLIDESQPAIFFLHSTTYTGGANWVAELDKESAVDAVEQVILPNYAAPFAQSGALYAPRYRQAALYAFMNNREDSILAREFAHADIHRAFDAFLTQIGPDRPFILAGVGQGGMHVLGLLMQEVSGDEALIKRLAAAYIIDAPVPLDLFTEALLPLRPCETESDVRCVHAHSWAHPTEERRLRVMTERMMSWTPTQGFDRVEGRGLLCTNPVLGARTEEYAPARLHRGAVAAEGFTGDATPAPMGNQTSAQCVDGILLTERTRSRVLRRPDRLAEEYRVPPFNLFYEDLRVDAARRVFNLQAVLLEEARWAPPFDDVEEVEEAPVVPIPDRAQY